jgi:hypothetical protein
MVGKHRRKEYDVNGMSLSLEGRSIKWRINALNLAGAIGDGLRCECKDRLEMGPSSSGTKKPSETGPKQACNLIRTSCSHELFGPNPNGIATMNASLPRDLSLSMRRASNVDAVVG